MMFMGFFWILIVIGLFFLFRHAVTGGNGVTDYTKTNSALDILKRRYASGEIGRDEYEEKKKALA